MLISILRPNSKEKINRQLSAYNYAHVYYLYSRAREPKGHQFVYYIIHCYWCAHAWEDGPSKLSSNKVAGCFPQFRN